MIEKLKILDKSLEIVLKGKIEHLPEAKEAKKLIEELLDVENEIIYKKGFEDGLKTITEVDFKIKLIKILNNTKGIGDKTVLKVLETLRTMEVGQ